MRDLRKPINVTVACSHGAQSHLQGQQEGLAGLDGQGTENGEAGKADDRMALQRGRI